MTQKLFYLFLALAIFELTGCAHPGPVAEKYPLRVIDQPFAVPEGMRSLTLGLDYRVARFAATDVHGSEVDSAWGGPFYVSVPLGNWWNIEWGPLPLSARYMVVNNDTATGGVRFGTGVGYSSISGWIFAPAVEGYYRRKLGDKLAVYVLPTHSRTLEHGADETDRWKTTVEVGPIYQLGERHAVSAYVRPQWNRSESLGVVSTWREGPYGIRSFVTVGAGYDWRVTQFRELAFRVGYIGIRSDPAMVSATEASVLYRRYW